MDWIGCFEATAFEFWSFLFFFHLLSTLLITTGKIPCRLECWVAHELATPFHIGLIFWGPILLTSLRLFNPRQTCMVMMPVHVDVPCAMFLISLL